MQKLCCMRDSSLSWLIIIAIKLPLPESSLREDEEEYDAPKWIDTCLYRNESNIFTSIPLSISGRAERSVSL